MTDAAPTELESKSDLRTTKISRLRRWPFPNPIGLPSLSRGLVRAGLAIRLRLTSALQVSYPGSSAQPTGVAASR